jgi:hypothetical protein
MNILLKLIAIAAFATFMSIVMVEWAVGCGEPIYNADGTFVTGECAFLPYEPVSGTWR